MKKLIFLGIILSPGLLFGMDNNTNNNNQELICFTKDEKTGSNVLTPEYEYSGLNNVLPSIGYFALQNKVKSYDKVSDWLLKSIVVKYREYFGKFIQDSIPTNINKFKGLECTIDNEKKTISYLFIKDKSSTNKGGKDWFSTKTKFSNSILDKDFPVHQKVLIGSSRYLKEKIHPFHEELLCQIYDNAISQGKNIVLTQSETKKFKLLPKIFQNILKDHVTLNKESFLKKTANLILSKINKH